MDCVIVGGGIAGLWLLDVLVAAGYACALVERGALGGGQTMAAQGIVHGGLKYALGGQPTPASEAIAGMPARWRSHLSGERPPDLRGTRIVADPYLLFAGGAAGRIAGMVASHVLAGRVTALSPPPPPFTSGQRVLALDDFAVDVASLLDVLASRHAARIVCAASVGDIVPLPGGGVAVHVACGGAEQVLQAQRLVLCAGAGNASLARRCGIEVAAQLRPLHQVYVAGQLPSVNAHCLTGVRGVEPRLTITSHRRSDGAVVWALGGALATSGVARDAAAQVAMARRELATCCGWLDLPRDLAFASVRIDRAEPRMPASRRPDTAHVVAAGDVCVAWPTKLSLAPVLADQVLAMLAAAGVQPRGDAYCALPASPPPLAPQPWEALAWS